MKVFEYAALIFGILCLIWQGIVCPILMWREFKNMKDDKKWKY
jgi:hydrogenase-4 membrane subunit HyfE